MQAGYSAHWIDLFDGNKTIVNNRVYVQEGHHEPARDTDRALALQRPAVTTPSLTVLSNLMTPRAVMQGFRAGVKSA